MKLSSILGLNARTKLYSYPYNTKKGKRIAASKLLTAKVLKKAEIPTPTIYAKFKSPSDVFSFDWESIPGAFAIKPSKGFGGEGIIVIKKKVKTKDGSVYWVTTQRKRMIVSDFQLHVMDILEGAFSYGNIPDVAFIQEYVGRDKAFRKYAYRGTPDIRIIVFNKVPVMAMLRLPTKDSGGRANLHQGAIGVGIDIATGITTKAVMYGQPIKFKPGTKRKLHGIKIPYWDKILDIAVKCQEVSKLGYLGADIVIHPEKGPMVLELNSMPGLAIQLANQAGLKRRLDRVDELKVRNAEHGVNIAKALFSEYFSEKVLKKDKEVISALEEIAIKSSKRKKVKVLAKIDTGAWRTSIDVKLAKELNLIRPENIIKKRTVQSALGVQEDRPIIVFTYWLKGKKITTMAGVTDRKNLKRKVIIGRKDLAGFLVKPRIDVDKKKE
ncbi:MAG: alpha-L-glutamate ligase-like protein [Patescibacteria group bacterium]|nr:alpha-L-glutamate ligase-like protein [Patescibacteria group bacterium]